MIALGVSWGCAARASSSSPFIARDGDGPIDLGSGPSARAPTQAEIDKAKRDALAGREASRPAPLPSIETSDGELKAALAALLKDDSVPAHIRVALAYERVHVMDAAFDQYSAALKQDPKCVAAWDGRARLWRDWGMVEQALHDVYRARYYGPEQPEVLNTLGTILERAGQCEAAGDAYEGALKLDPAARWAQENVKRMAAVGPDCRPKQHM